MVTSRTTADTPGAFDSLLKNAAYYAAAGIVAQLLSLPAGIIIRRILGPSLVGITSTLELAQSYAGYTSLGVIRAAARELPYSKGAGDEARAQDISETALAMSMASGCLSSLVVVILGLLLLIDVGRPEALAAIGIYALVSIPGQLREHYLMMARSNERFRLISQVMVTSSIVFSGLAIGGVLVWGIYGFLGALVVQRVLRLALLRFLQPERTVLKLHWTAFRRLLTIGLPMAVGSFLYIINITADDLVVVWLLGPEMLGVYSVAIVGKGYLWQVMNSMASVWHPRLQLLYGNAQDGKALAQIVLEQCRLLAFSSPLLLGLMFLVAQTLVGLLLDEFVDGVAPFQILLIAVYLRAVRGLPEIYIDTIKKQQVSLGLGAVAVAGSLLAVVLMVRAGFGLEGAAIGASLGAFGHYLLSGAYFSAKSRQPLATAAQLVLLVLPIAYAYGALEVLGIWVPWVPGESVQGAIYDLGLRSGLYILGMVPLLLLLFTTTPAMEMVRAMLRKNVNSDMPASSRDVY